jgi:Sel1 repeat
MSSPVHHPQDLDAALRYAPPWARKTASPGAASPDDQELDQSDYDEPPFDGDRAMLDLQYRLSLDPDQEPEPPVRIDNRPTLDRIVLRLCAVAGVAALVAWASISLPTLTVSLPFKPHIGEMVDAILIPALAPAAAPATASAPTPAPASESELPATPVKVEHIHAAMAPLPVATEAPVPAAIVPVAIPKATPSPAPALPEPAPAVTPPQQTARPVTLAPDELAMLIKRGKDLLTSGDISAARLLLRRAAEAGNADAALAFGSTFDPAVIARLGAIGVKGDAAKAREWYEKAAALGSNTASQQIAHLAEAGR